MLQGQREQEMKMIGVNQILEDEQEIYKQELIQQGKLVTIIVLTKKKGIWLGHRSLEGFKNWRCQVL